MKTYLRILQYARPYADFLPLYLLYTVLGIFFSIGNFALIIPLLNVLFDKTGKVQVEAPDAVPHFAFSLDYITHTFNYYFAQVIAAYGKLGALSFVCAVLVASVFFSNVFRYLSLRLVARVRARVIRSMRRELYRRHPRAADYCGLLRGAVLHVGAPHAVHAGAAPDFGRHYCHAGQAAAAAGQAEPEHAGLDAVGD